MKAILTDEIVRMPVRITDLEIEEHLRKHNRFFRKLREEWTLDEMDESSGAAELLNAISRFSAGFGSIEDAHRILDRVANNKKRKDAAYIARQEAA